MIRRGRPTALLYAVLLVILSLMILAGTVWQAAVADPVRDPQPPSSSR